MDQDRRSNPALADALAAAEARFAAANPESARRHRQAMAVMPGGNTRSVLHYAPFPVVFRKGEGSRLTDLDGHVYADFLGDYSAGLYGHSHPAILSAARAALDGGIVLGGPNRYEAELAALVAERFPSCELLRFCNSGTEANLMALAAARVATGREAVLAFDGAYHGGVLKFAGGGSPLNVPFPTVIAAYNDPDAATTLVARHAGRLAAIIVEPMLGSAGAVPGERDFLLALRESATRHGIVLIFDEVMTSRLAPGGLQGALGIAPDMTTFGKYLGGGFSCGAFGGARQIMARFDPTRGDALAHAGTFNNNVLSMAAGLAGLGQVYTPDAALALSERGERFRARLNAIFAERQMAVQATGAGSLLNVHFQRGPIRRAADIDPAPGLRALFHLEMMARGYYLARRGFMALSLALLEEEYAGFGAAVEDFCDAYAPLLRGD